MTKRRDNHNYSHEVCKALLYNTRSTFYSERAERSSHRKLTSIVKSFENKCICMIKHWFEEVNTDNLRAAGEEISVFTSENECFIII